MKFDFPVLDNHVHLQPIGRNVEAAKDFQRVGGTHLIISHMPYPGEVLHSKDDFLGSYQITLDMAESVRRGTDVKAFVTLGPYPVLLLSMSETMGLQKAKELMMQGMDAAAELIGEGRAVAIGEVGRPHFPVSEDIMEASNEIMQYAFSLGKELDCPVVVHAETATPESLEDLGSIADRAGLPRGKVVKHYCGALISVDENHGIYPSVLASKQSTKEAFAKGSRFLLETDFMDDPDRPGAVLAITTVPKRMRLLVEQGIDEDVLWKVNKDNPERLYGISIE